MDPKWLKDFGEDPGGKCLRVLRQRKGADALLGERVNLLWVSTCLCGMSRACAAVVMC